MERPKMSPLLQGESHFLDQLSGCQQHKTPLVIVLGTEKGVDGL